ARKRGEDVQERQEQMKQMSAQVKELTERVRVAQEERQQALAALPNTPHPSAAEGPEDEVVREVGELPKLGFEPRDHLQLAGAMIDTERAANVSGSRFAYLKGELVTVELALVAWALAKLRGLGFEPVIPPALVRERALYGTGFLPETDRILAIEKEILQELGLPYRVVNIAVGELGSPAAKKYDCEAWIPSQGRYRELTSCSDTTDYQARRLNIRMRSERGTRAVHTLNGTAVAVGRTLIALLENGQRQDGSVELPAVLAAHGAPARLEAAPAS